jgi:RNA polymerase sigma-70 factor, ECF subfamily
MSSPVDRKQLGDLLHQRLLSGDPTATAKIFEAFFPPLVDSLRKRFSRVNDDHLIQSAAGDAMRALFLHPTKFDPARGELFTYLLLRARGYLLNSLRREKGEGNKVVELDGAGAVNDVGSDPEAALISREFQEGVISRLLRVFTDPADLRVLALMIEGERETEAFADALGVADRPPEERRKLVKQVKDRIIKTLERKFGRKKRRES